MKVKSVIRHKICIIGLGYVGLPLAVEFAHAGFETLGYDKDTKRVGELINGLDKTGEVRGEKFSNLDNLNFSNNLKDAASFNFFIVCVPTPVDKANVPDLSILKNATRDVGLLLKKDDIVVFESTVYPGVTEEICVPILQTTSGLSFNSEFFVGYSPERINPGDSERSLQNIVKIVSCSSTEKQQTIVNVYDKIISAGIYLAQSIKIAEAAKVIENTQRDVNIALVNELAIIFNKLNIKTKDVIDAAATKWNFIKYHPGLVGGHCIGVDPYYLTYKAQEIGYHPEIISAGRRINDYMPNFVCDRLIKAMFGVGRNQKLNGNVLILGATFKENCPDIRNSKVFEIIEKLSEYGIRSCLVDPIADLSEIELKHGIKAFSSIPEIFFDCVLLAVPHFKFDDLTYNQLKSKTVNKSGLVFDLRGFLDKSDLSL